MSCAACPRVTSGWFRGCLTATFALDSVMLAVRLWLEQSLSAVPSMVVGFPFTLVLVCLFTGLPAGLLISFAEALRVRSRLSYISGGAAIGAMSGALIFRILPQLSALFVVVGAIAGTVYWSIAGRYAGEERGGSRH